MYVGRKWMRIQSIIALRPGKNKDKDQDEMFLHTGCAEGGAVGLLRGWQDGAESGCVEGLPVDCKDGRPLGQAEGCLLGPVFGRLLGCRVGGAEGPDGCEEGLLEGALLGRLCTRESDGMK